VARLPAAPGAASSALAGYVGGATPPLPSALAQAALEGDLAGKVQAAWPPTPRTAWLPPWRGWGGRSWPATREFYRSAADAEKPAPELDPTCNSRFGPADRRKEDASNKKRLGEAVLRAGVERLERLIDA
jgi:hypothetical protein